MVTKGGSKIVRISELTIRRLCEVKKTLFYRNRKIRVTRAKS